MPRTVRNRPKASSWLLRAWGLAALGLVLVWVLGHAGAQPPVHSVHLPDAAPPAAGASPWLEGHADLEASVPTTRVVPNQFVVRFRDAAAFAHPASAGVDLGPGIKSIRWLSGSGAARAGRTSPGASVFDRIALVTAAAGESADLVLARLRQHPALAYAEPNTILILFDDPHPARYPNDFHFGELWNLHNPDAAAGRPVGDIRATFAWALTTGDAAIRVAVIDTGIDFYHPDLEANVWTNPGEIPGNGLDDDGNGYVDDVHGYDFVSDDSDPMDDQIHGTHVAGTIGAVGNNEIGVTGVCWQTSLMAIKAFNASGEGSLFDVIAGIRYAVVNGARILNASWGQFENSKALAEAIAQARAQGMVIVAAAGNTRSDALSYPAAYPEVLTVAALDSRDERSIFSSYGPHVDLSAPGQNILSTVPDNRFEVASGTSMAAPHVAGVAALVLSRHPEFTPVQVEDILRNAVDPIQTAVYCGAGRLNAWRAVRVDVPLPTARLELPPVISGRIDLEGTASSPRFRGYALDYGQGVYPTNWTRLHAAELPVDRGALLADWSTDSLPEGSYVLRLTVWDTLDQQAVDRAMVTIRNVHLASPLHTDVVRAGSILPLTGTVYGTGRTYTIAHGIGRDPSAWSTDGIVLANGGQAPVIGNLLGTWDTGAVAPNTFYSLKLTAWAGGETIGSWTATLVHLDGQLRPGWPQHLIVPSGYSTNDWRQIVVADLDQDGAQEILTVEPGNLEGKMARLLVYRPDGALGWSRALAAGFPTTDLPTVGDIDGDGMSEVFVDVGDSGRIWAFRHDGRPLDGDWPALAGGGNFGKVLADLDGDGTGELVVYGTSSAAHPTGQRMLAVLDRWGRIRQQWFMADAALPLEVPRQFPAVADLDDDPDLEIVAIAGEGGVAMFDLRQPEGPVWQAQTGGFLYGSPVVGDIDGDHRAEVIVASHNASARGKTGTRGGVFVYDREGQIRPGWPVLIHESFTATPALGDLDHDGALDIVAVNWEEKLIHLLRYDGFDHPGWPVGPILANDASLFPMLGSVKSMPVVGDVNGDGWPDVVVITPGYPNQAAATGDISYFGGVKAWSRAGKPIDLHPHPHVTALVTETGAGNRFKAGPPVLTDLDGNGRLDIVASTIEDYGYGGRAAANVAKGRYSIYAWELDAPHVPDDLPWPMFQRDPAHTGSVSVLKPANQPPAVEGIPSQTIRAGGVFFPIELDRYVLDPDHPVAALTWTIEGASDLLVALEDNRVVAIEPPTPEWTGVETLRFVAHDPGGLVGSAVATFAVRLDYVPPLAVADVVELDEDTACTLNPLANDSHPRGLPLRLLQFSRARAGSIEALGNGLLRYQPEPDFFGEDSFAYLVDDGQDGMALAWVTLRVRPVPDAPVAVEDRVIAIENTPIVIDVLANDTDADGDALALTGFGQPANGAVEQGPDASLVYRPRQGWSGIDSFGYSITDGQGHETSGTVVVQVKPVNDPPVAQDQVLVLNRNTSRDVIYQAVDPDGDALSFEIVKGPDHGEFWAQPTVATYYPRFGFAGEDTVTYIARDGELASSPAVIRFVVLAVNNPPIAAPQSLTTKVGRPIELTLDATDADADPLSFEIARQPAHGTVTVEGSNALYAPRLGYLGDDSFTFTAHDGQASSSPGIVSLRMTDQNMAPIAESYRLAVPMNRPTNVVLRAIDGENDPLQFTIVTNPAHGRFSGTAPNLIFTPHTNYYGPDRFAFTVHDGELQSAPGVVALSIVHPNTRPETTNQWLTAPLDAPVSFLLEVTDSDTNVLRAVILEGPRHGRVHGLGTNFVYTPRSGFIGSDSFTYRVWDGIAYSPIATVSINVQTTPPPTPPRFEALKLIDGGMLQMRIATMPGRLLRLEVSTDLASWEPLLSQTPSTDTVTLVDTNAASLPRRFYRAVRLD